MILDDDAIQMYRAAVLKINKVRSDGTASRTELNWAINYCAECMTNELIAEKFCQDSEKIALKLVSRDVMRDVFFTEDGICFSR